MGGMTGMTSRYPQMNSAYPPMASQFSAMGGMAPMSGSSMTTGMTPQQVSYFTVSVC